MVDMIPRHLLREAFRKNCKSCQIPAVNHNHNKMCFCNRSINPPSRYCRPHLDCNQETVRLSKGIFVNSQSVFCLSLNSPFRVFILIVCSDSFIKYTYFTYIMILAGFLPNISCEGKDFVATWLPGFPLSSHPGEDIEDGKKVKLISWVVMVEEIIRLSIGKLEFVSID